MSHEYNWHISAHLALSDFLDLLYVMQKLNFSLDFFGCLTPSTDAYVVQHGLFIRTGWENGRNSSKLHSADIHARTH